MNKINLIISCFIYFGIFGKVKILSISIGIFDVVGESEPNIIRL